MIAASPAAAHAAIHQQRTRACSASLLPLLLLLPQPFSACSALLLLLLLGTATIRGALPLPVQLLLPGVVRCQCEAVAGIGG
jgi:hypothetical protein